MRRATTVTIEVVEKVANSAGINMRLGLMLCSGNLTKDLSRTIRQDRLDVLDELETRAIENKSTVTQEIQKLRREIQEEV